MKEVKTIGKKCRQCGEHVESGAMKAHWLKRHSDLKLPHHLLYQKLKASKTCSECGEKFRSSQALTWHRKREHNLTPGAPQRTAAAPPPQLAVHFCPQCGCDLEAVQVALNFRRP